MIFVSFMWAVLSNRIERVLACPSPLHLAKAGSKHGTRNNTTQQPSFSTNVRVVDAPAKHNMRRDLGTLPKAELHIHLEGSMRRETLIDLCNKYDISVPTDTRGQRFRNFNAFVDVYLAACECLREDADLYRLVLEIAEDAAASGARWIEPALSQSLYNKRFGGAAETLRVLCRAAEEAEKATGVGIGYIVAAERIFPVSQAEELAELVRKAATDESMRICGRPGIIGFGLHGNEEGFPPAPFAKAFSSACENTGVASVPHAGEIAPHPGNGVAECERCQLSTESQENCSRRSGGQ